MPEWLLVAASIAGALLALIGLWHKTAPARSKARSLAERGNRALDVVLGTPELPDPDRPDGPPLRPAIPDIGVRMTKQETLLQQYVAGSDDAARLAAENALRIAEDAASKVQEVAETLGQVVGQVEGLTRQVSEWQNRDRVQAETATAVLHEVGMTLTLPQRPDVGEDGT